MKKLLFSVASVITLSLAGCAPFDDANGPYSSMDPDFSKTTSFNIAQQVNNPKHLTEPAEVGPANSQAAVGAISRYQKGEVRKADADLGSVGSK